jgi:ATPase subunit of ABC transporter with duplicated ATPase domains
VSSSGHVEVAHVSHVLPDGRTLLDDVSFRIGEGITAALVGPNGAGKTTLLRLVAGDIQPQTGTVTASGGLGVMRQFIGGNRVAPLTGTASVTGRDDGMTPPMVRDLLLSVSPRRIRDAAARLDAAELAMMERDDERAQLRYAAALTEWGEAGGYAEEVHWDACCVAAVGIPYDQCRWRDVNTLSGGEQKRLVLESLLRAPYGVLLLDEPDNYLDVPGKRWLEQQLAATPKTVLLVSHDRELLAACAQRIVTVEDQHVWVHGGGFSGYAKARADRISRLEELRRRWDEEHEKLKELVRTYRQKASYNSDMASRLQAAVTRLRRFEEEGPPEQAPREQNVRMRLRGGRTGKRAVICENLTLTGTTGSFGTEIWFDDRVAVLGANGSGKSSFLRLLAGEQVPHEGIARLGARVVPGFFAQTHINEAMAALARYELQVCARQPFGTLSGGQQARLQILLLELAGATLLLLDEPTDNLDLPSAEALQQGLESYRGTVLAVTHDRWFARSFERFLIFTPDGQVRAAAEPAWD